MRRDMDRALDSDAGPKGTVLCWRGSSLAQKFYVMLCYGELEDHEIVLSNEVSDWLNS